MRLEIGDVVRLTEPLPKRCCGGTIAAGEVIYVYGRNFPDRPAKRYKYVNIWHVLPAPHGASGHNVKTSKVRGEVIARAEDISAARRWLEMVEDV